MEFLSNFGSMPGQMWLTSLRCTTSSSVLALCMNVKQAHLLSLFSTGLVVSQTRREWVGDAGSSQGGTCPHPCHALFL